MIKVSNKNIVKTYYFPKNIETVGHSFVLEIISKLSNIIDSKTLNDTRELPGFYSFRTKFNTLHNDEYEYKIWQDSNLVGRGMILVTDDKFEDNIKEYDPKIIYTVYNGAE